MYKVQNFSQSAEDRDQKQRRNPPEQSIFHSYIRLPGTFLAGTAPDDGPPSSPVPGQRQQGAAGRVVCRPVPWHDLNTLHLPAKCASRKGRIYRHALPPEHRTVCSSLPPRGSAHRKAAAVHNPISFRPITHPPQGFWVYYRAFPLSNPRKVRKKRKKEGGFRRSRLF